MTSNSVPTTLKLNSGYEMPTIGLGTWKSKPGEVSAAVKHALKVGYKSIDAALVYGNENEVGEGIRDAIKDGDVKREEIFVTSKLWGNSHHPDDVETAVKKSLSDLGLAYLDLYLIHWPHAFKRGSVLFPKKEDGTVEYLTDVTPTETWLAMEKLVEKGLVRSIGLSNFNSEQIKDILDKGKIPPATNQVECHPYFNQQKLLDFCMEKGIYLTAYSPLGSPDRPWASPDEPNLLEDPKLAEIAKRVGKSAAQVLLRYQLQRKVIVIPKSVTPSRIEENFALLDFELSEADMKTLDGFARPDGRLIEVKVNGKVRDADHPHYPFNIEF